MIDLAPPGLLDRLIARKALGKTPPSVTKLSHRDTPLLNSSKDRRPFLPRPAKTIPVKQIAMVHDAGIDASAPKPPGKDILAGNDAQIRKLASPRLEGQAGESHANRWDRTRTFAIYRGIATEACTLPIDPG